MRQWWNCGDMHRKSETAYPAQGPSGAPVFATTSVPAIIDCERFLFFFFSDIFRCLRAWFSRRRRSLLDNLGCVIAVGCSAGNGSLIMPVGWNSDNRCLLVLSVSWNGSNRCFLVLRVGWNGWNVLVRLMGGRGGRGLGGWHQRLRCCVAGVWGSGVVKGTYGVDTGAANGRGSVGRREPMGRVSDVNVDAVDVITI